MKSLTTKTPFVRMAATAFFFLSISAGNRLLAQINTISATTQHLYISIDDYGNAAKQYLGSKSDQIGVVVTIYGRDIYPNDPLKVNEQTLTAAIAKAFPDSNAAGIATMDWEGKAFDILAHRDASDPQYQAVLSEFQKALQIAKSTRPNVKWGFYDFPFRRIVFTSDQDWKDANSKIAPLLQNMDCFFPAFYMTYSMGDDPVHKGALASGQSIYDKDTREAIRLAVKYNKPVLPFIWHRYEVHDSAYRDKVIPPDQFAALARTILDATYKGHKVNGIVWWSRDTEFFLHGNKQVRSEASDVNGFKTRYDSLVTNYSDLLLKQVQKKK